MTHFKKNNWDSTLGMEVRKETEKWVEIVCWKIQIQKKKINEGKITGGVRQMQTADLQTCRLGGLKTCQPAYFWIFATLIFNENSVLHVVLLILWSVSDSLARGITR